MKLLRQLVPWFYLIGIAGTSFVMPFNNVAMSVASLWVLGTWIMDMLTAHTEKQPVVRAHKHTFFLIASLFLLHIFGLLWTSDFKYAMRDLNTKLPLILFPVVIYTMTPLKKEWWRYVRWSFLLQSILN